MKAIAIAALVCVLFGAAPAPKAAPSQPSQKRQAEIQRTIEKRKAASAKKAAARAAKAQAEYQERRAQEAYMVKVAPIIAKQQADMAKMNIEQQKANAFSSMANAAQKEAAIDLGRLRVEQRQAGVPFVPSPNGMVAYPFAAGATNP